MSNKKNIDRLFQEKFKEFEVSPDKSVWSRLEAELDSKKKKEKKILPIWWKLGGIAAILALLIAIGYNTFNNENSVNQKNTITETPQSEISKEKLDVTSDIDKEKLNEDEGLIVKNASKTKSESNNLGAKNSVSNSNISTEINEDFVKNSQSKNEIASKTQNHEKIKNDLNPIKNNYENNTVNDRFNTNKNSEDSNRKISTAIVSNSPKNNTESNPKPGNLYLSNNEGADKTNLQDNNLEKDSKIKNSIHPDNYDEKDEAVVLEDNKNDGKKSLLEIAEKQEKELEKEVVKMPNKWSINPNVAPVYYNTIGSGSPINSEFSDNTKEGDINMSYGINVAYQLNNKLSIRSGINKVNYGYSTQDIAFTSSAQGEAIGTVNYAARASNIKVLDNSSNNSSAENQSPLLDSFNSQEVLAINAVDAFEGSMNQQFGYLEIPLELKYRVLDKKFGVNVIGGVSSLFLTKNQITVESNSLVTEIGEANNLNNTNFSTNIGVGFDYKFSNAIQFNVEPMFKYQLNAFSNNDGGFKPFSLGVYTGLSFKF